MSDIRERLMQWSEPIDDIHEEAAGKIDKLLEALEQTTALAIARHEAQKGNLTKECAAILLDGDEIIENARRLLEQGE